MVKYYNRFILLVCALLIQESIVVGVYEPPGTEATASRPEAVDQSKTIEDEDHTRYNDDSKNSKAPLEGKVSEGGDKVTLTTDQHGKLLISNETNGRKPEIQPKDGEKQLHGLNFGELSESHEPINSSVVARKGVDRNSVVPRKGVSLYKNNETTNSDTHRTKINTLKTVASVKEEGVASLEFPLSKAIKKKPVTSDKDSDDGDSHSFIESSSTGQDYVLTGVLIFVCIWASIFGGLFFFKRAGEFWDRRHYRRMDFLVEGMYND